MTREEFHQNTVLAASKAQHNGEFDAAEALEKIAISSSSRTQSSTKKHYLARRSPHLNAERSTNQDA